MLGWIDFGETFLLCPLSLCLHICQWCPHSCTQQFSHPSSESLWLEPLALLPHLPLSHWYPARTHCPHSQNAFLPLLAFTHLSRLSCSFSSGTHDLNDGKSRGKEKGDNMKRSSRKKRQTKKRERVPFADSQLYHTMLKLLGNESLFSASDPFTSIRTQFSQMERGDVQWTGAVSKDKMWEGLIWHTWTQWEALLLFYRN